MKVRLLANDSKIPNIAIMKISSYHKSLGDDVNWYDPMFDMYDTDIFYESKIFTFSPDFNYYPVGAKIFRGGTGIDVKSQLPTEIERITEIDSLTGEVRRELEHVAIFPNSHYVVNPEKLERAIKDIEAELAEQVAYFKSEDKLIEAQRIAERTNFDMEMLRETGLAHNSNIEVAG